MGEQEDMTADVVVIGGGVVGLAIASTCTLYFDHVFVLERQARCGTEQSTRNSGVIHPGLHYPPGSLKAQLCVQGNRLLYDFCERRQVPYRKTGELIVAVTVEEEAALAALIERAEANRCPGVVRITPEDAAALVPGVQCAAALFVPSTGIVEAAALVSAYRVLCLERQVMILTERWPVSISADRAGVRVGVAGRQGFDGHIQCRHVVNAAGLGATDVARLAHAEHSWQTVRVRGEYAVCRQPKSPVCMPVYRVPQLYEMPDGTRRQTLGVHLTPTLYANTLGQELWIGPTVKLLAETDDLESNRYTVEDIARHVHHFFPGLTPESWTLGHAGITPRLLGGSSDFVIECDPAVPGVVHLLGIDSPGLTSAPALAIEVCARLVGQ